MDKSLPWMLLASSLATAERALADTPVYWDTEPVIRAPSEYEPPRPPPYVAPFQLRSIFPKNGVRLDTTFAPYQSSGIGAHETVWFLSGQLRLHDTVALQTRWGFDHNSVRVVDPSRWGILSPTLGILLSFPIGGDFRLASSLTVGIPLATGGGNSADPKDVALQKQGMLARSAMDNTSFAVNDVGLPLGVSFAYVKRGATVQVDSTIIASIRAKGEKLQQDENKVNSTYGFFAGTFVTNHLSFGGELRYQRYLSTPVAVEKDATARDNLTMAMGARLHFELEQGVWMRPGLSYAHGLRGLVEKQSFHMVQLDVPVSF